MFPVYNNKKLLQPFDHLQRRQTQSLEWIRVSVPRDTKPASTTELQQKPESYYKQFKDNSNHDMLSRTEL